MAIIPKKCFFYCYSEKYMFLQAINVITFTLSNGDVYYGEFTVTDYRYMRKTLVLEIPLI